MYLPSWPPCQAPPARSPIFHTFSLGPTATTSPTVSWPGTIGLASGQHHSSSENQVPGSYKGLPRAPDCTIRSEWQTPVARTLIRISPSPGSFSSRSSMVSGSLAFLKRAALNVFGSDGDMLTVWTASWILDETAAIKVWKNTIWMWSRRTSLCTAVAGLYRMVRKSSWRESMESLQSMQSMQSLGRSPTQPGPD